jgi:hypothetical protein
MRKLNGDLTEVRAASCIFVALGLLLAILEGYFLLSVFFIGDEITLLGLISVLVNPYFLLILIVPILASVVVAYGISNGRKWGLVLGILVDAFYLFLGVIMLASMIAFTPSQLFATTFRIALVVLGMFLISDLIVLSVLIDERRSFR